MNYEVLFDAEFIKDKNEGTYHTIVTFSGKVYQMITGRYSEYDYDDFVFFAINNNHFYHVMKNRVHKLKDTIVIDTLHDRIYAKGWYTIPIIKPLVYQTTVECDAITVTICIPIIFTIDPCSQLTISETGVIDISSISSGESKTLIYSICDGTVVINHIILKLPCKIVTTYPLQNTDSLTWVDMNNVDPNEFQRRGWIFRYDYGIPEKDVCYEQHNGANPNNQYYVRRWAGVGQYDSSVGIVTPWIGQAEFATVAEAILGGRRFHRIRNDTTDMDITVQAGTVIYIDPDVTWRVGKITTSGSLTITGGSVTSKLIYNTPIFITGASTIYCNLLSIDGTGFFTDAPNLEMENINITSHSSFMGTSMSPSGSNVIMRNITVTGMDNISEWFFCTGNVNIDTITIIGGFAISSTNIQIDNINSVIRSVTDNQGLKYELTGVVYKFNAPSATITHPPIVTGKQLRMYDVIANILQYTTAFSEIFQVILKNYTLNTLIGNNWISNLVADTGSISITNFVPLVRCRFILSNIILSYSNYNDWLEVIFDKCDLFSDTIFIIANTNFVGQIQFIHCKWNLNTTALRVNLEIIDLDITNLYVNGTFSTENSGNMRIINMRITGTTIFSSMATNNLLKSVISGIEISSNSTTILESPTDATILYSNIRSETITVQNFEEGHISGLFCTDVTFDSTVIVGAVFSDIIATNKIIGESLGMLINNEVQPVLYTNLRAGIEINFFSGNYNKIANFSTLLKINGSVDNVFI